MDRATIERLRKYDPLITKWATAFHLQASVALAICEIESAFRPDAVNRNAVSQGGAWGMMQVTSTTAETLRVQIGRLCTTTEVTAELREAQALIKSKWAPSFPRAESSFLFDPELNVMLGTFYLSRFSREFGPRLDYIACAYHNGAGFLRKFLAEVEAGTKRFPEDLPPKAAEYVRRALAAQESYLDDDKTPRPVVVAEAKKP